MVQEKPQLLIFLIDLLCRNDSKINFNTNPNEPTIIMMVGLQGSGKTTICGKIANLLRKQGKKPLMCACDVILIDTVGKLQIDETLMNELKDLKMLE